MEETTNKTPKPKRIAAMIAIILLAALYLGLLIAAIVLPVGMGDVFIMMIGGTIGIPIVIWLGLWAFTKMTGGKL